MLVSLRHFAAFSFVSLLSITAHAENTNLPYTSGWGFSGYVDNQSIDSKVAEQERVDDSAIVVGFAAERYNSANNYTLNLGLDILIYDDKAEFTQETENTWSGDTENSDSAARGFLLYADYGPRFKFGADNANYFTVRGGFSIMISSDRSIGNCTNCWSEDIDIDGGAYGLLGIGHSFGSVSLGLQAKQYLTGDLGTGIGIKLSSSY
jgi:hypothetical protein